MTMAARHRLSLSAHHFYMGYNLTKILEIRTKIKFVVFFRHIKIKTGAKTTLKDDKIYIFQPRFT